MSVAEQFQKLEAHASQLIIGQAHLINRMLIALLCDGHLLVEGAPGLAKTRAIKVLAESIEGDFHRLQFTPDLLPADLTGTDIYRPQEGTFEFRKGPLFHNLILADEINRAPAKVQSALLEAMEERQISVGDKSYPLEDLFMVMATQNPIEQEGTYPLPEAQLDRFLLHVQVGGCSLPRSSVAASLSNAVSSIPDAASTWTSRGLPTVSVPVLSTTSVSTLRITSIASASLNSTPIDAPLPVAVMIDIGVARPSAQGQAMINTATALIIAKAIAGSGPTAAQTKKVTMATSTTAGTK